MNTPACPICGAQMKSWGRGATSRKHGRRWVCPVAQAEVADDERGHLKRRADAQHTTTRIWTEDELEQEAQP